ncbi:MAG: hypothetical protein ABSC23_19400 [Bryobacteraceae bacterium]|jgi:hypothetical protein
MTAAYETVIEIGAIPIRVRTREAGFHELLQKRYGGFTGTTRNPAYHLEIELHPPSLSNSDADAEVWYDRGRWIVRRGDFRAELDPQTRRGVVRQSANPYSIDAVLRILHTLLLAGEGGFLVHAASAMRNGRAFLFSGVSGAGKTTISRLAPPDVTLMTDEVSYVRRCGDAYRAFGTPFAGELGEPGANISAPIAALFLLAKGPENRREPMAAADMTMALLRNILFFAGKRELVGSVFQSACDFVHRVPIEKLVFRPDPGVWEMIA